MPKRPSKGVKGVYLELRPELVELVKALAERNGRPWRVEVEHALERHLAAPPTVVPATVEVPPLAAIEVSATGAVAGQVGRPRKATEQDVGSKGDDQPHGRRRRGRPKKGAG